MKLRVYIKKSLLCLNIILIMSTLVSLHNYQLDNDIWYILTQGRYIAQNGLYNIDPFTIHEGLNVVVQNWLSSLIFWNVYDFCGELGILSLIIIINGLICTLLYKICMLISDNNKFLSIICSVVTDIFLIMYYIVSRGQIFSFVLLLSVIYFLEKYIKTNNGKYLIVLPIISLLQINLHASLWLMIFLYSLPYIIDGLKFKKLGLEGYRLKPILIALFVSILVGFINPYSYKAITFIIPSFFNETMHELIGELHTFSIAGSMGKIFLAIFFSISLMYTFIRKGNTKVRYLCLLYGTMILGISSYKGLSNFLLVAFFPFAYFFKDIFNIDFNKSFKFFKKFSNVVLPVFFIASIGLFGYFYYDSKNYIKLEHTYEDTVDVLLKDFNKNDIRLYVNFNNGGYTEFRGIKSYIDPRAEYFLKSINKKADILDEYVNVNSNMVNYEKFFKKYDFTHLIVELDEVRNYLISEENNDYILYYADEINGIYLYARKDLLSKEKIKELEKMDYFDSEVHFYRY